MKTETKAKKTNIKKVKKLVTLVFLVFSFANFGQVAVASDITAQKMVELTNKSREESGLLPLKVNDKLVASANAKVDDMFKFQYFDHNSPNGITPWHWMKSAGYDYLYAGENLAIDFVTAEGTHVALMRSITHRDNILKPNYTEIGIAVKKGIFDGNESIIIVEHFGAPLEKIIEENIKENNESEVSVKGDANINLPEAGEENKTEGKQEEAETELVEIESPVVYFKDENYEEDKNKENGIEENEIEEIENEKNQEDQNSEIEETEEIKVEKISEEFILPIMFPVKNVELLDEIYVKDIFWNSYKESGVVDNLKAKLNDYFRFLNVRK